MSDESVRRSLGERVRRRRERLGITIDVAAESGGISPTTWLRIEQGGKVRRLSYAAVDRAIGWTEGACAGYLHEGIEPTSRPEPSSPGPTTRELQTELRRQLAELRATLEAQLGDRNRGLREALIHGLEEVVENSNHGRE